MEEGRWRLRVLVLMPAWVLYRGPYGPIIADSRVCGRLPGEPRGSRFSRDRPALEIRRVSCASKSALLRTFSILAVVVAAVVVAGISLRTVLPESYEAGCVAAVDAYDPDSVPRGAARILAWWEQNHPETARNLRPGLSDAEIDALLEKHAFGYELPDEVRALYRWRNGSPQQGERPFIWYHRLLGLEEALERADSHALLFGMPDGWLPLLWFQEEYYFVICGKKARKAVPVLHRLLEVREATLAFTNVGRLCLTGAEWFESGAVTHDGDGWFKEHDAELLSVHGRLNPSARFPYATN